jgi:hypothetical protein
VRISPAVLDDVMNTIRNAAAAAGLLAALAVPLASSAQTTTTTTTALPQRYTMQTQYFDDWNAGAYVGTLALTVYPSGVVQGTYHDASAGGFKTVVGGLDEKSHIWLDIGNGAEPLRLYGTFKDGVLKTIARATSAANTHHFESVSVAKTQ